MNRRDFLRALIAVPVAAAVAVLPKERPPLPRYYAIGDEPIGAADWNQMVQCLRGGEIGTWQGFTWKEVTRL